MQKQSRCKRILRYSALYKAMVTVTNIKNKKSLNAATSLYTVQEFQKLMKFNYSVDYYDVNYHLH